MKRNALGPGGGLHGRAAAGAAPGARAAGAGVVGGSGHGHRAVKAVEHQFEVARANGDIGVALVDLGGGEVGHADLFCRPLGGGGHHLHQTGGTHARFGVHDEAAFLADQAVDIGRVQANALRACHHGVFERHRKALLKVHHAFGALAGVDAAVPHLGVAGQVGGSQQAAVVHAALGVQVGAVVPLSYALGAQPEANGVKRPLQTGVLAGSVFFFGSGRGWTRWHGAALAEFVQRQLLVKAAHPGNALQVGQRLGAHRLVAALGQHGACMPVNPR